MSRWFGHVTMLVVLAALLSLSACQDEASTFPQRLERALASGSPTAIEPLLTQASRPHFRAMVASSSRKGGPFSLGPVRAPSAIVKVQAGEGGTVLSVRAAGVTRDWVLVHEEGALRLDLMATSARRPWNL